MFSNRIRRSRIVGLAAVLALALSASGAFAQPGPGGPHGGDPVAGVIEQYKSQLALDTLQQGLWENAVAATRKARQDGRALMQQAHDAMADELAKPEPDLAVVAAAADSVHAQAQALRKPARDAWLKLYATFTQSQKAIVRDALSQRLQHMEQMRQRFGKG